MTPLVSIIIPVFNRVRELERALASVHGQSYPHYEVLVIDDHSTVDLTRALSAYSLTALTTDGKGVSAARNTGIKAARGELLAFLDSDDEWLPTKLEKQVEFMNIHTQLSIVHSNETWWRNGAIVPQPAKYKRFGGDVFAACTRACLLGPSTVMLRKALLDSVGVFDTEFPVCEDFDLWLRITAREAVGFIEESLTIKHGGHADQLSMQYHSMDLWRVRALAKHLNSRKLSALQTQELIASLVQKSEILLKGFDKHQNDTHRAEIQKYLELAQQLQARSV